MELVANCPGLLKAIKPTIRVKVRALLKLSWYTDLSFENDFITRQELVDFGAFLSPVRSRDKIVKVYFN